MVSDVVDTWLNGSRMQPQPSIFHFSLSTVSDLINEMPGRSPRTASCFISGKRVVSKQSRHARLLELGVRLLGGYGDIYCHRRTFL